MDITSIVRSNVDIRLVRLPDSGEVYDTDSDDYDFIMAYIEADGSIWIAVFADIMTIAARIPANLCVVKY